ncbi:MAG: BON domain-containing protein [Alphaproteobacteria bacterium]|nr:BON domain-containing protein [Alphaproteobacteria bacterium]
MLKEVSALSVSSLLLLCTGCDPVTWALGGTAFVGTETVRNKDGATGDISDMYWKKRIKAALYQKGDIYGDRTELAVKHGIVVVIGSFDTQEQCDQAMEIVRSVKATDVFDELKVEALPKPGTFASDSLITTRISSALTLDGNVYSLNYDMTTVNGIVYICGTATTTFERDLVLNHARSTSGVKKVVSYVKLQATKEK